MSKLEIQKLKAQNASSVMFFILIVIMHINVYPQINIEGTFCVEYDLMEFSTCLTFEAENIFSYKHSGHLGAIEYGKGVFKFTNNRLILNYNKTSPKSLGYYNLYIWENNSDSINIIVNIYNKRTKEPIEHANVFFKDNSNKLGYTGTSANRNGNAVIETIKDKSQIELNVIYLGFVEQKINLIRDKNYSIEVYLKEQEDETGKPILNQIDSMEVIEIKPKYFTTRNKNGSETVWRKIEEEIED